MTEVINTNVKLDCEFNIEKPVIYRKYLTNENFAEALNEIEIEDNDGMDEIMKKLEEKGWIEQSFESGAGRASSIDYSGFEPGKSYNDF